MAQKPRVQAPKQRSGDASSDQGRNRQILLAVGGLLIALVLGGVLFFGFGSGAEAADIETVRTDLEAAGCTLTVKPAVANVSDHSDFPDSSGTSPKWNTDPPTSGPHYGQTLIYGAYTDPLEIGRVLHNLEHGAVYILYGDDVPASTVSQLKTFYDAHATGTILAPYPKLGDEIALGVWLAEGLPEASSDRGTGVLATCTSFDGKAFATFLDALQFKGPESSVIPPSSMEPGDG
jgi:hypothetical protein